MGQAPEELTAFCRAEWPRLVGALCLMSGDLELAKELAQETVVRICRNWRRVRRMEAPGAWAHRVAMNLARSHFRHLKVTERVHAHLALSGEAIDASDLDGAIAVRAAVAELPERQRMAIVLRYFVDLSVRDTAEVMRCPEGTVKTLTFEAIRNLRERDVLASESALEVDDAG
ncbi:MAG: SigE family RNA polymerase sigma factor [Acidimicrobiia bacterium]